ncbi:hypothetical protein Bca101_092086 [Brassica carinata]
MDLRIYWEFLNRRGLGIRGGPFLSLPYLSNFSLELDLLRRISLPPLRFSVRRYREGTTLLFFALHLRSLDLAGLVDVADLEFPKRLCFVQAVVVTLRSCMSGSVEDRSRCASSRVAGCFSLFVNASGVLYGFWSVWGGGSELVGGVWR